MIELQCRLGGDLDVPAGDIGVGGFGIGFSEFGIGSSRRSACVLTGKGIPFGGSLIRPEATGVGFVYFVCEMVRSRGDSIEGKRAMVSGSGNVSRGCILKLIRLGTIPISCSDSKGNLLFRNGMKLENVDAMNRLKTEMRLPLSQFGAKFPNLSGIDSIPDKSIWNVAILCEIALPSATQNEIRPDHIATMVKNGRLVAEGANVPATNETIALSTENGIFS